MCEWKTCFSLWVISCSPHSCQAKLCDRIFFSTIHVDPSLKTPTSKHSLEIECTRIDSHTVDPWHCCPCHHKLLSIQLGLKSCQVSQSRSSTWPRGSKAYRWREPLWSIMMDHLYSISLACQCVLWGSFVISCLCYSTSSSGFSMVSCGKSLRCFAFRLHPWSSHIISCLSFIFIVCLENYYCKELVPDRTERPRCINSVQGPFAQQPDLF